MSWAFYADAALTTLLTDLLTQHWTDHSEGSRTAQVWLGETAAGTKVQAISNPGVDPITVSPVSSVSAWAASTAYSLGAVRTPTTPNGYVYTVTTAGTSAASQPTWPTTIGATVTDGGVTWTCSAQQDLTTEYKLAATEAGLAGATAGAGLSLGTQILSGIGTAATFWVRVTNGGTNTQTQSHVNIQTNALQVSAV